MYFRLSHISKHSGNHTILSESMDILTVRSAAAKALREYRAKYKMTHVIDKGGQWSLVEPIGRKNDDCGLLTINMIDGFKTGYSLWD